MTHIVVNGKEYNIKYGFEATMRSGILKKLAHMSADGDTVDKIEMLADLLPEMVLVGLQKFHNAEFGYDYKTGDGKDEQIDKVYNLLDEYFDGEEADFMDLLDKLQAELMENGFLAKMLQKEQAKTKVKSIRKATEEPEQPMIEN